MFRVTCHDAKHAAVTFCCASPAALFGFCQRGSKEVFQSLFISRTMQVLVVLLIFVDFWHKVCDVLCALFSHATWLYKPCNDQPDRTFCPQTEHVIIPPSFCRCCSASDVFSESESVVLGIEGPCWLIENFLAAVVMPQQMPLLPDEHMG